MCCATCACPTRIGVRGSIVFWPDVTRSTVYI
jgi:hypothetical protein